MRDVALACATAILLLLIPATLEPFLSTCAFETTRSSILPSSAFVLWQEGWPFLGIVFFLFVLVFPPMRFVALTAVLLAIRVEARPRWLGRVFRLANALQTWAMLDVFFLGMAVAYVRLHASILVTIDTGGVCFVAAALLSVIARATLDKRRVWRLISPDADTRVADSSIARLSCDLVVPKDSDQGPCPRCSAVVHARRPDSISRSTAVLVAAMLLYFPANLYPIATIPLDFTPPPPRDCGPERIGISVDLLDFSAHPEGAKLYVSWVGTSDASQPRSYGGTLVLQTARPGAGSAAMATAFSALPAHLADRIVAELSLLTPVGPSR